MADPHSRPRADLEALRAIPLFVAYNANVDGLVRVDGELEAYLDRPRGAPGETDGLLSGLAVVRRRRHVRRGATRRTAARVGQRRAG